MADDFDFLDAIAQKSDASGPRCPNCGQSISKGAVICLGCGFNLRGGDQLVTSRGGGGMDPTVKLAAIGGAVLVVVILVLAFMMMSGGDEPRDRESDRTVASAKPVTLAPQPAPEPTEPATPEPTEADRAAAEQAEQEAAALAIAAAESSRAEQERMRLDAAAKAEAERKAQEEAARLAAEKARMDAERKFQASVDTAIASAQKFLFEQYDPQAGRFNGKFPQHIGESALATYALLKSGVDPDDERIVASLKNMLEYAHGKPGMDDRGTYSCGIVMLALDELRESYARKELDSDSSSSESADARRRRLMIKGAMRKLAMGLNRNQQTGKSFSYGGGASKHGHDLSIHQYALLGMWAAYRSGVKLVPGFWNQQVKYLMELQKEDGGFAYKPERAVNGTMTTAGVGSLAICYLMLNEDRLMRQQRTQSPGEAPVVVDLEPQTDLEKAIARGFEWIATKGGLNVGNPYYNYGLERMCALTQTSTINGQDWYRTMAEQMVRMQQKDGSWLGQRSPTCDTAWNLLFLARGTEKLFKDPIYEEQSPGDESSAIGEGQKVDKIEEAPPGEDDGNPQNGALDGGNNRDFRGNGPTVAPTPGNPTAPGINPGGGGGPPAGALPKLRELVPDKYPGAAR